MTDKEKIKMLIEAIDYSFLNTQGEYDKELTYPVIDKVKFIKKSMQEEPVSEELDKAAESWIDDDNNTHGADYIGVTVAENAFKAGANWQKEQLMKGAEECYIRRNRYTKKNVLNGFDVTCDAIQRLKGGDKVKVIVIKED